MQATKLIKLLIALMALLLGFSIPGTCVQQHEKVTFDGSGRMLIGGKPEFPIGIYTAFEARALKDEAKKHELLAGLDDIKNSPFRLLINYGDSASTSLKEIRQYLDEVHKRGIREMFSIKDYRDWQIKQFQYEELLQANSQKPLSEKDVIQGVVREFKSHPAVLGWYLFDEPDELEPTQTHGAWLKEIDSSKPSLVVHQVCDPPDPRVWTVERNKDFVKLSDIVAMDYYLVPKHPLVRLGDSIEVLQQVINHQRPFWGVVQTHGNYVYTEDVRDKGLKLPPSAIRDKDRAPTPREIRTMTYIYLTHGATGIVYYYYADIKLTFDSEVRWEAVKSIAQEVKDLSPILLAEDVQTGKIRADNALIHWTAKQKDGKTYIIAVNTSTETQSSIFTLPSASKKAKLVTGTGLAYPYNNELLLTLDGYEAVVVELS